MRGSAWERRGREGAHAQGGSRGDAGQAGRQANAPASQAANTREQPQREQPPTLPEMARILVVYRARISPAYVSGAAHRLSNLLAGWAGVGDRTASGRRGPFSDPPGAPLPRPPSARQRSPSQPPLAAAHWASLKRFPSSWNQRSMYSPTTRSDASSTCGTGRGRGVRRGRAVGQEADCWRAAAHGWRPRVCYPPRHDIISPPR